MVLRGVLRQLHRRLSLWPMLGLLFVVGVFVPIGVLLNLPATPKNVDDGAANDDDDGNFAVVHLKPQVRTLEDENDGASLKRRIAELERLRDAVRNDVRDLERRRQSIQQATQTAASRLEEAKSRRNALAHDVAKAKAELQATRADLRRLASQRGGIGVENDVVVVAKRFPDESRGGVRLVEAVPPKRVIVPGVTSEDAGAAVPVPFPGERMAGACRLLTCFDFSRCSLTTPFAVYLYDEGSATDESASLRRLALHVKSAPYYTSNPNRACLYLVLVDSWDENAFKSLAHWRGDGRNHLLVDVTNSTDNFPDNVGRAIVARHSNPRHRLGFDVVAPPIAMFSSSTSLLPPPPRQLPAFRRYLIYFRGEWNPPARQRLSLATTPADLASIRAHDNEELVVATECTRTAPKDATVVARPGEWHLCGTSSQRVASLSSSTFALILGGGETTTHARLVESLRAGAVPIVVGDVRLPFDDVLDWSRVAFRLADARATELNFFLRAVAEGDVLDMRRRGRFVWETYFGSATRVVDSVVAVVRTRIGLPPNVVAEARTVGVFADGETSPFGEVAAAEAPSPRFQKNFTLNSYDAWNNSPGALVGMPSVTPFVSALPSGFQYMGRGRGKNLHRTVRDGGPLNGPEFDVLLAGNVPDEQFTIVMLTFDRNLVLTAALERLRNLQYLRTIVVVWNNPQPPPANMEWPNIGIPIHVITTGKNSLNNRFLPFDKIETEAVLSMDDDAHLRHDEIQLAFRVWRENKDRIVGFPGRFHAWDARHPGKWNYNANYSCEMSMVLTGAAFFHKYYMYLYSYTMSQSIRDKVDEYMNCEDIAMNFLVSHVTRKPPVKVTSRWTFRCPGCPEALSGDNSHFEERHECINYFVRIYGYMPLLYTQFRADSILFKTRIPSDRTKCFKFI